MEPRRGPAREGGQAAPHRGGSTRRLAPWARRVRAFAAALVVAVAVVLVCARLLLGPAVEGLRPQVQAWLGATVGKSVRIGRIEANWRGWTPVLRLEDVRLRDPDEASLARFSEVRLSVDVPASIAAGRFRSGRLTIRDAQLSVTRGRDGSLSVGGLGTSGAATGHDAALAGWLFSHRRLRFEGATLVWDDRLSPGEPVALTDVHVGFERDGPRHQVTGTARLPPELGDTVAFAADLRGSPVSPDWSGTVFLHGGEVRPAVWPRLGQGPGLRLAGGTWTFRLWTTWEQARLESVDGEYAFQDVRLEDERSALVLRAGEGLARARRIDEGWRLDLRQTRLATSAGEWEPAEINLRVALPEGAPPRYAGRVSFLRIEDVLPLASTYLVPEGGVREALRALAPRGTLEALRFTAAGGLGTLRAAAKVHGLRTRRTGRWPGLRGLSGRVAIAPDAGRLELAAGGLAVSAPGWLAEPLALEQARGTLRWTRGDGGWRLEARELELASGGLRVRLAGRAHWPFEPGRRATLLARIGETELAELTRYFPPVLDERFRRWWARAIQGGRLTSASLLFDGPPADFPFDGGEGALRARLQLAGAGLAYHPEWPALEGFDGVLTFRGRDLDIELERARIMDVPVAAAEGRIAAIGAGKPLFLEMAGRIEADTSRGLEFIRETPLARRLGGLVQGLRVAGEGALDLELKLPLPRGKEGREVRGTLRLADNRVEDARLRTELEAVNGVVRFSQRGIAGEGLEARYLGHPVEVDVHRDGKDAPVRVRMAGHADRGLLGRQLRRLGGGAGGKPQPSPLLSRVSGRTPWEVQAVLAAGEGAAPRLGIRSSLEGMALDLPAPFGKPAGATRALRIDTTLGPGPERVVRAAYGEDIRAALRLERGPRGHMLERGEVRIGDGAARLPEEPGLVVRGRVRRLAANEWLGLLRERTPRSQQPGAAPASGASGIAGALREARLGVDRLALLGHVFPRVPLRLVPAAPQGWRIELRGPTLDGTVEAGAQGDPVVVDLDRLALGEASADAGPAPDPRALPPIKFSARRLVYKGLDLGGVKLSTSPTREGLRIDPLYVFSEQFEARAEGLWHHQGNGHRTAATIRLTGNDLGAILGTFGYEGGVVQGGATDLLLDATWPGPPTGFALEELSGMLEIKATDGRLVEVQKGATGRIFGLLSLHLLPRRLRLDFSDVFDQSFRYDVIEGRFRIEESDAYTNNLTIDGPTARIDIAGRVGLDTEDYDQRITVTPKLAASLPLAPVWLLEKLLNRKVFDKSFARRYAVTGPWEDPKVEPVDDYEPPRPER